MGVEGNISLRVENNGRVGREEGGGQEAPAEGPVPANAGGTSSGSGSPAGIRHPPPSSLAEVVELYNATQARLATHSARLTSMLREDPELQPEAVTPEQTFFNNYSSCLHLLAHAQHAMSDIMINLSRPPVIQSVVQSGAIFQSVGPLGPGLPPPASAS